MADPSATAKALNDSRENLKKALRDLSKACEASTAAIGATKDLYPEIALLYDECRDIYTRLAWCALSPDSPLGVAGFRPVSEEE